MTLQVASTGSNLDIPGCGVGRHCGDWQNPVPSWHPLTLQVASGVPNLDIPGCGVPWHTGIDVVVEALACWPLPEDDSSEVTEVHTAMKAPKANKQNTIRYFNVGPLNME